MFSIEFLNSLWVESRHLHAVDFIPLLVDSVNDLSHIHVTIRLDSSKSSLPLVFEMVSSMDITVVHHLKNSRHNCHISALEEIIKLDLGNLLSLKEGSLVLTVKHLNRGCDREVEQPVISYYIGLLVVPFHFESESLFSN